MMHVYLIPKKRSNGYCFGGPVPILFGNVDWMDDPPTGFDLPTIQEFLQKKDYFKNSDPGTRFLVLCDIPGMTFQMVKPTDNGRDRTPRGGA